MRENWKRTVVVAGNNTDYLNYRQVLENAAFDAFVFIKYLNVFELSHYVAGWIEKKKKKPKKIN